MSLSTHHRNTLCLYGSDQYCQPMLFSVPWFSITCILGKRWKTGCSSVHEGCDRGNCLRIKERWEGGRKRGGSIGQEDQMEMWKPELKGLWACEMNDGEIKRGGEEKSCRWRGKQWRKKDRLLEICLKGTGKDEGFGMKVKNEQLREIGRERDGEKRQRGLGSP